MNEPKKFSKLKILIIEDNKADLDLINILLAESINSSFNYDLTSAKTLKKGISLLDKKKFDIILLDLFLPDSEGLESLKQTYKRETNIPIIVLTGLNDVTLGRKAVRLGAQDYLVKGDLNENQLIQSIFHSIERKDMVQTIEELANNLKAKESKLRKIIDMNADAILIINKNGKVRFINPAAKKMFGRGEADFINQYFGYPIPGDDKVEIEIIQKNGNIKYAEMKSVEIQWEEEDAHLLSLRDITEHRKFEMLLQESEKKYRELFEKSPYPILILNKKGIIVDGNSNLTKLLNEKKRNIINQPFYETALKPMEILELFPLNEENLEKSSLPNPTELKIFLDDEKLLWLNLNFSLVELNKEKLIHVLIEDITNIKRSKEEVQKLEKTLHEMNALIEYAPLAIFLMHPNGKILRANLEAKHLFKYRESELLNQYIFNLIDTNSLKKAKEHYEEEIYDERGNNKIEVKIKSKNGDLIHVEITSTVLKIADNYVIQSFISDITKRKNYERNREALLDQLIKSLEFKSRFLATMSHDLRTPLNAIVGFSSLLLDGAYGDLNESQKDYLEDIYTAAEHLTELIDSILDFSKIEAGKFELNFQEFSLNKIIKQVHSTLKPLYKKKDLYFKIEGLDEEITLYADPLRIKQIFYNLLDNAIKFTEDGGIILKLEEKKNCWEFQIIDTGMGISEEDYEVVFREFGRVEKDLRKDVSGSGIGLALTKRVVYQHGGDIWFNSTEGKGSTFFFTIPKNIKFNK